MSVNPLWQGGWIAKSSLKGHVLFHMLHALQLALCAAWTAATQPPMELLLLLWWQVQTLRRWLGTFVPP